MVSVDSTRAVPTSTRLAPAVNVAGSQKSDQRLGSTTLTTESDVPGVA